MCDKKTTVPFMPQDTSEPDELNGANINLPYKGPTTGMNTSLKSRTNMKYILKQKELFEVNSDICDLGNYLETKATLKLNVFSSGPYDTVGSKLEFQNLYFHFKNIVFNLKVRYYFNPLSTCKEEFETFINNETKSPGSLMFVIDEDKGISFETYSVSNGPDEKNVNALFYDLEPLFENYNSTFRVFYDAFVDIYEDDSILSNLIRREFVNLLCEYRKTLPPPEEKKVSNPYQLYKEKIDHIKKLNLYSTIFIEK
jgi:hypothetical protein